MFGIGTEELALILVIALVVLGPERMPKLARDLGKMVGDFRRTSDELRNEFLNADSVIDVAARSVSTPEATPVAPVTEAAAESLPIGEGTAPVTADVGVPLNAAALLDPVDPAVPPQDEAAVGPPPVEDDAVLPGAAAAADPDETLFDREAREAHERLHDPARARQAAAEGWKTPTDEAGTTDRWG